MHERCESRPIFTENDIHDLTGYVVIVTGGNSGIGLETTKQLALHNARVYMASRSMEKGNKAIAELRAETSRDLDVRFLRMDLLDLKSVVGAAEEFGRLEARLDLLINNAGIMNTPFALTRDGFETQWQANYLAHQIFTSCLLPKLLFTAHQYEDKTRVRVVNVVSDMALMGPKEIQFDDVNMTGYKSRFALHQRYGHSKQAGIRSAKYLNDAYSLQGVTAYSVHPGITKSNLQSSDPTLVGKATRILVKFSGMTPLQCSYNSLWAATSTKAANAGQGRYFGKLAEVSDKVDAWLADSEGNKRLWEMSEDVRRRFV